MHDPTCGPVFPAAVPWPQPDAKSLKHQSLLMLVWGRRWIPDRLIDSSRSIERALWDPRSTFRFASIDRALGDPRGVHGIFQLFFVNFRFSCQRTKAASWKPENYKKRRGKSGEKRELGRT